MHSGVRTVWVGFETAVRDFKQSQAPARRFEPAKDVAAFTNNLGGSIIIGAAHSGGVIQSYSPMQVAVAEAAETCFSEAVQQRCRPEPVFDVERISYGGGFVVVVNVEPSIPLVGVMAKQGDPGFAGPDNSPNDAWLFPLRVGTGTGFISPERLPMYMVPEVRRKALLLRAILPDVNVRITYAQTNSSLYNEHQAQHRLYRVDEAANLVVFDSGGNKSHYPLDQLETVYERQDGWRVRFGIIV